MESAGQEAVRRVLVVDDEPSIGRVITRILRHEEVEVVASGAEALDRLERDRGLDLVLCDVMMPHMSGLELFDAVCERWPDLARRFVFITGGVLDEADERRIRGLVNPCLYKPFAVRDLRALLEGDGMGGRG